MFVVKIKLTSISRTSGVFVRTKHSKHKQRYVGRGLGSTHNLISVLLLTDLGGRGGSSRVNVLRLT